MKVFRPILSNILTQGFGENRACVGSNNRVTVKINNICPAGTKELYSSLGLSGHNGEDWMLWRGEPIYFPVVFSGVSWSAKNEVDGAGGIGVDVISKDPVDLGAYKGYIKFRFWHLQKSAVVDGQMIFIGQLLGYGDSTGLSSGDHLHWALKTCDEDGNGINTSNGYFGAIDFALWFENRFVLEYQAELLKLQVELLQTQLTLIQVLNKYIFILRTELIKLGEKVGSIFIKK